MTCFRCGGPTHPATYHWFGPAFSDVFYCGPCARDMLGWMKRHLQRRWAGADFYAEASSSVRADRWDW